MRWNAACGWVIIVLAINAKKAEGQNYIPIPVMGYNHDIFTEAFPNTHHYTDTVLDASLHIMYTTSFAALSGLPGGLPISGSVSDSSQLHPYQLAPYGAGNALTLMRNTTGTLTLATPGTYSHISLLAFSTEGASSIDVRLKFTDGTITGYLSNYSLADWFYSNTNVVIAGFGRCQRTASAPYAPDGYASNPRFYFIDIPLNCNDRGRRLKEVILSNVTATGSNAPFPNAVFLALSGIPFIQTTSYSTLPATCSAHNGSATLNLAGTYSPYSVSWNTNPVQVGSTVTNLAAGTYTATINDAQGCTFQYPVTIPQAASPLLIQANAAPAMICRGDSTRLTISSSGGTLASFTWNPGNLSGESVRVSPSVTTLFTVTGSDQLGCPYSKDLTVTVNPTPTVTANGVSICNGETASLEVQNPQPGEIYNWYSTSSGGNLLFTGTLFQIPLINRDTSFYITAVNSAGCTSIARTPVTVKLLMPLAKPVVKVSNLSATSVQFIWLPVSNAHGYEISLNGGTGFQAPSSGNSGTSHTVQGLLPGQTLSIQVRALGSRSCETSDLSDAVSVFIPYPHLLVPNAFTPNGDGKNDILRVVDNSISTMDFHVFNRWGQEVFVTKDPATGWDGRFQGKKQPAGVYVFVLKGRLSDGSSFNLQGMVSLIR